METLNQTRLVKNLTKSSEQEKAVQQQLINETQKLLGTGLDRDKELLRKTGLDFLLSQHEELQSKNLEKMKTSEEHLGLPTIDFKEVSRLCLEYNLVLINSENFMGPPPPTNLMEVLRQLANKTEFDRSDMYIICTPDMASSTQEVSWKEARKKQADQKEAARLRRETLMRDPILLYRVPKTELFVVLQSWGNDLSPFRKTATAAINFISKFWFAISLLFFAGCLTAGIWNFNFFNKDLGHAAFEVVKLISWITLGVVIPKLLSGYLFGDFEPNKVFGSVKDYQDSSKRFHFGNKRTHQVPKIFNW